MRGRYTEQSWPWRAAQSILSLSSGSASPIRAHFAAVGLSVCQCLTGIQSRGPMAASRSTQARVVQAEKKVPSLRSLLSATSTSSPQTKTERVNEGARGETRSREKEREQGRVCAPKSSRCGQFLDCLRCHHDSFQQRGNVAPY